MVLPQPFCRLPEELSEDIKVNGHPARFFASARLYGSVIPVIRWDNEVSMVWRSDSAWNYSIENCLSAQRRGERVMHKGMGIVFALSLMTATVGCGTSSTHPASAAQSTSAKGCPAGTVSMNENGHIHCLAIQHSSQPTSSVGETLQYQANAHWPGSTNRAAQHYAEAVVRYMNRMGDASLPKQSPLSFPLRWTAGLANGGGPSGIPILLWQLSLPPDYKQWSAAQWQRAIDVLETQYFMGGLAKVPLGVLKNASNGVSQSFQLVASNGFAVRFSEGDTIPNNSVGVTTPIPTYTLMWAPPGTVDTSYMNVVWDEWLPPVTTYPQLISIDEAHTTALNRDFQTSAKQLLSALSASAPRGSFTSSSTIKSNYLIARLTESTSGIRVSWKTTHGKTPQKAVVTYENGLINPIPQSATLMNGGFVPGVAVGDYVTLLDVRAGSLDSGAFTPQNSVQYGATEISTNFRLLSSSKPNEIVLSIEYTQPLPAQIPDQRFTNYHVIDDNYAVVVSGTVTRAVVQKGDLLLTVVFPGSFTVNVADAVSMTAPVSVAHDAAGAPVASNG